MRLDCLAAFLCLMSALAFDQIAVVQRNVNLRSDPSTGSEPITRISPAARLTLLEPNKQNGYYHVRAADGQEDGFTARMSRSSKAQQLRSPPELRDQPAHPVWLVRAKYTLIRSRLRVSPIPTLRRTISPTTFAA
jgi:uncharacterized protein YgiM (DUF1202 family)